MPVKTPKSPVTISRADYIRDGSDLVFRESIYMLVQGVSRLLSCRNAFGRALGLTASQFAVLMGVSHLQGAKGVAVKALADHVALNATHVTTEVGRLDAKGLLCKRPSPTDGRSVLVSLTTFGQAEIARVEPLVRAINDLLFQNIEVKDLATATSVSRMLVLNSEYATAELRMRAREARSQPEPAARKRA